MPAASTSVYYLLFFVGVAAVLLLAALCLIKLWGRAIIIVRAVAEMAEATDNKLVHKEIASLLFKASLKTVMLIAAVCAALVIGWHFIP
ncbi:MAG: hypothetical protein V1845_00575 [bacterium]